MPWRQSERDFVSSNISSITGSFVSFCQFFTNFFTLSARGSCLIFTGNKFTTSGNILQNSDGDRRYIELMEGAINKFILIPSFVLLQGIVFVRFDQQLWSFLSPYFFLVLNRGLFRKGCPVFPSLYDP